MLGQFLVGVVTVLSGSRTLRMLTVLLGCPQVRESGSKVLIDPNPHQNRPHHRHQRGPQKSGNLSLPVRIGGIRALMSPRSLQAFFLRHRVIRQIKPLSRWQTVQTKDGGALVAHQIIGHGPCARMVNHPVKWHPSASHLNFGEQRGLQSRPRLFHQDFEPRRRLNLF